MNNKKIVAGLLALSFVFGGAALPNTKGNNNGVISASAGGYEVYVFDNFEYIYLENNTVEITDYIADCYGPDVEIYIPDEIDGYTVSSIGEGAFSDVNAGSVSIPDGVTNIADNAFSNSKFENIYLPMTVKKIGRAAFSGCKSLKCIYIPEKVTNIDYRTFLNCESLAEVEFGGNVRSIEFSAFEGCTNLETIDLPKSVEMIGDSAFKDCKSLKSITIPDGVTTIEACTFEGCKNLNTVILPDSLESIGNEVFVNCTSLETLYLPDRLQTIGEGAFFGCTKLKNLYITDNVTEIGEMAFAYRNRIENEIEPLRNLTIYCYKRSYAQGYAEENGLMYRFVNYYPEVTKIDYNEEFHQFRVKWSAVDGAEKYGIAVRLAGKWKVQAYTEAENTTFTSPKLKAKSKYNMVICAKIDGEWDTSNISGRAFTVTVK